MENKFDVQTSILVAGIIIAGAVVYSAHSGGRVTSNNPDLNVAAVAAKEEKANLTERSNAPKNGTGKVVITEFSDFQCPYCQRFYSTTYQQIKKNYIDSGKVTFIYRHLPLGFHANAEKAAEASECANMQGKFWQYHDKLFDTFVQDGSNLSQNNLKAYAQDLGLDTARFNSCLDNRETAEMVRTDLAEAQKSGISGTPTFVINGKKIVGAQPYEVFKQAIDEALR